MKSPAEQPPVWVAAVDAAPAVEHRLADIQGNPFAVLTGSADGLAPGEGMVLNAPFNPLPLCRVLSERGFETWSEELGEAQWRVRILRPSVRETPRFWFDADGLHLDVRDLPPPSPMIEALRLLDGLQDGGDTVVLHTPQFPVPLLPELEERGWAWEDITGDADGAVLRLSREEA